LQAAQVQVLREALVLWAVVAHAVSAPRRAPDELMVVVVERVMATAALPVAQARLV
jgi:hypothetical protein